MKNIVDVPQFLPNGYCLSCQGCCRFESSTTDWRPQIFLDEIYHWRDKDPEFSREIFTTKALDKGCRLRTEDGGTSFNCRYLDPATSVCHIYQNRPWECRIYPFLIRRKNGKVFLSVHGPCPYVRSTYGKDEYTEFVEKFKRYLTEPDVRRLLAANAEVFPTYEMFDGEIVDIQELLVDGAPKATGRDAPFGADDRQRLEVAILKTPSRAAVVSLPALEGWRDFFEFEFREISGTLCVFAKSPLGVFQYFPPLGGPITTEVVEESFRIQEETNGPASRGGGGISRIENVTEEQKAGFPDGPYEFHAKGSEYCYERGDIVGLKGDAYKSKRSSYNQFVKTSAPRFVPYEPRMLEECLSLYGRWAADRRA